MILKTYKAKPKPEQPKPGDRKTVKHFAFFPIRKGDHLIWLEYWYEHFEYRAATEDEWNAEQKRISDVMSFWCLPEHAMAKFPLKPFNPNAPMYMWFKLIDTRNPKITAADYINSIFNQDSPINDRKLPFIPFYIPDPENGYLPHGFVRDNQKEHGGIMEYFNNKKP